MREGPTRVTRGQLDGLPDWRVPGWDLANHMAARAYAGQAHNTYYITHLTAVSVSCLSHFDDSSNPGQSDRVH